MANVYFALYRNDGSRISEGDDSNPLVHDGTLIIPTSGERDSNIIPFTAKTLSPYKTEGSTTLELVGSVCMNRWRLGRNADLSDSPGWGQPLVISDVITSGGVQLYAQARCLGPLADAFTLTNDTINNDYSTHIRMSGTIVRA